MTYGRRVRTEAAQALLERDDELAALSAAVDAAADGSGGLVWLEGPAGIGKSRLLHATAGLAQAPELALLQARGGELEREFPFGVVRQLFEARLAEASEEERAELLDGPAGLAAPLVDVAPGPPMADASFPVLHALYWLTTNLALRSPLVLLVDDVQWADPPSLRALAYLARRVRGLPCVLVVAARIGEAPADEEALRAIADSEAVLLRPAPLSLEAETVLASERLEGQIAPRFVEACHAATGGNPFLVTELLDALAADGASGDEAGAARVRELSPATVARAALTRLVRLGPDATALAEAVAVLGTQAELREAASLAGLDGIEAAAAADRLADAHLFHRSRPLDFVHPLVRRCVYDDMAPSLRARMHEQAARELAAEGREGAAAHLIATDPAGDRWVVEQLEAAAQRAMAQGAPDAAVRFLSRALAEPPPNDARGRVLGALGSAEARVPNRAGDAVEHLREASELAGDPFTKLFHGVELGQALLVAGRVDEAAEVLDAELRALPDEHDQIGQLLQSVLQMASYASPRARTLVAERGWRFVGDDDATPQTPGDRVWLAIRSTEVSFSRGGASRARDLAQRALDGGKLLAEQSADSAAFYLAANTLIHVDALDEAIAAYDAAIAEAQRRGSLRGFGMASCWRAYAHFWRGSLADAIADARATLDAVAEADLALGAPQAGAFLVQALTDAGELDAGDAALAAARAASDTAGDQVGVDLLHYAAGRLRIAQGRNEQALEELTTCGRRQEMWGIGTPLTLWRGEAARVLVALDRREEARALATEEVELACRWGEDSRQHAMALRALAATTDGDEALGLLRQAVAILETSPARLERARALIDLGSALRRSGERTAARDPLRDALSIARKCGAHPLAARAHDELSASGIHQRKILRGGLDALTPSERRIAELAGSGQSNRDIAATLFVTVRTVEAHLGHAYRKLGITGRAGLAGALSRDTPSGGE